MRDYAPRSSARPGMSSRSLLLSCVVGGVLAGPVQAQQRAIQMPLNQPLFLQQGEFVGGFGPVMLVPPMQDVSTNLVNGFTIGEGATKIEETPAGEAIKQMQAGEWVKAIQTIESLTREDPRMVVDASGMLRPLASMKSALILSMPEEGKKTFRRLNEPAARTRLLEAESVQSLDEKADVYEQLVRSYVLCDTSAQAALRLGDLRFEQGRFGVAAAFYRFAAEHAATPSDDPDLTARRLIALSRAGDWRAFDRLAQYAAFRHAQAEVRLGGESTGFAALIASLSESRESGPVVQPKRGVEPLSMPAQARPHFSMQVVEPAVYEGLQITAMKNRLGGVFEQVIAPVIEARDGRLYMLSLGSVSCIDPKTGNVLWQHGDASKYAQRIQNRMYNLQAGYEQQLVCEGKTLLAVVPEEDSPIRSRMTAFDAETGEVLWDWHQSGQGHYIQGRPVVYGDRIYTLSNTGNNQTQLTTVALDSGKVLATQKIGAAANDPQMGVPAEMSPRLTMGEHYLFVQTNNGALLALDPADNSVAWGFSQKIRESDSNAMRRRGRRFTNSMASHTGAVVAHRGLVVAKDTRGSQVQAFYESQAALAWVAETEEDATIVHVDDRHVYVLGSELVALDLKTGERVWWSPHLGDEAGTPVFTDDACLVAGNQRLCMIDLSTGKLTGYSDDIAERADLARVGNQLIYLTYQRLSSYDLPTPNNP